MQLCSATQQHGACRLCMTPVPQSICGCSPLPEVDLCLFADDVAEPPADTLDGGHGIHDVLLAIHIGVENTQDVLEIVSCYQALQSSATNMRSTALHGGFRARTPHWQLLLQTNHHQLVQRQSSLTPMVGPSLPANSQGLLKQMWQISPVPTVLMSACCALRRRLSLDLKHNLILGLPSFIHNGHRDSANPDLQAACPAGWVSDSTEICGGPSPSRGGGGQAGCSQVQSMICLCLTLQPSQLPAAAMQP